MPASMSLVDASKAEVVVKAVVVVEVIVVVAAMASLFPEIISFLAASRVSSLSNSMSQIAGHTEAKYRKTEGQNLQRKVVFTSCHVNRGARGESSIL